MEKVKTRKLKHNSKTTKIKCLHCNHLKTAKRNDAIYCSALCRVQEENYRKQIGISKLLIESSFELLKKQHSETWFESASFHNDFTEMNNALNLNGLQQNWKYVSITGRFIIYFCPNGNSKSFKLYYDQELNKKYKEIKERVKKRTSGSLNFKYKGFN